MTPLEVWAGVECTVNRVGDRYFDQIARTGHDRRVSDLDRIASLGVATVRYPVLWERTWPGTAEPDWRWLDERLGGLRDRGIAPIAGLVHHGSGPLHTSLLDERFPELLAAYAGRVARRYPWLTAYTPINEPLTTARFSGLYGHWYPHRHDDLAFARCLLTECKATVLAMQAVRAVNRDARLVMTEDLGFTQASASLAYQAAFENERRWLAFDLVCGRVDATHPLRTWLRDIGVSDRALGWFLEHPCPPDLVGCNYYATSERYLDHALDAWPAHTHGGNGRHRYADVAAARVCGLEGIEHLLAQAWARFRIPLAVTEVHLGCTREQQLRWLVEIYAGACRARGAGVDVRAITPWAMFGSFDWHCLVTRDDGVYEPGLFDIRGEAPRPTALARAVVELARGTMPSHPTASGAGWWHAAHARAAA